MLQAGARALMPGERVATCLRCRQKQRDTVEVWHSPKLRRAWFRGLQTCASVWMCPVCAVKITERRKQELTRALIAAHALGLVVVMVTYTLRHNGADRLTWLLGQHQRGSKKQGTLEPACGLLGARQKASGGRAAQALYAAAGVVGSVRALEVTHHALDAPVGLRHGWHPHIHELLFLDPFCAEISPEQLAEGLRSQWDMGLRLAGMREVKDPGFSWTMADTDIAAYVEKFGHERSWNTEHELTKQPTKKGREHRCTPTDLLRAFAVDGDVEAGTLWQEYARAMRGCAQLYWSPKLRGKLLPGQEDRTDQEVAEDSDEGGQLLSKLDLPTWAKVLHNNAVPHLLNVAANGDAVALGAYLDALPAAPEAVPGPSHRLSEESAARLAEQQEAAELGLTWLQWRQEHRGGLTAVADPGPDASPPRRKPQARRGARRRPNRREVRRCEENLPLSDPPSTPSTCS